jgi:hypothetical protein
MRMTDETPRVNHSFASLAYVIFRRTKPHIGSAIGEAKSGQLAGLMEELPRPPDER